MKSTSVVALASLGLVAAAANAAIYDISATDSQHTFAGTGPAGYTTEANGFTLPNNGPGTLTYTITPVDISGGGLFTAANRFGNSSLPSTGWEWNYWVQIDAGPAYQVGFGGAIGNPSAVPPLPWNGYGSGVPSAGGVYTSTAASAFADAPAAHSFSLNANQSAKIYWLDDNWGDNVGGISVNVTVVPEPEAYGLALAGMGVVLVAMRRRRPEFCN